MKIGDVLHKIGSLPYLSINVDCTLAEASKKVAEKKGSKCFFCPGNEKETPPEILRVKGTEEHWKIRVFLLRI